MSAEKREVLWMMPEAVPLQEKVVQALNARLPEGYRCTGCEYFDYGQTAAVGIEKDGLSAALLWRPGGKLREPDYEPLIESLIGTWNRKHAPPARAKAGSVTKE